MRKTANLVMALLLMALVVTTPIMAQSTTKTLSTNFTLVNLGGASATGAVNYYKPDGTAWKAADNFTLAPNGGQIIYRQYDDPGLTAGKGSVVISADQPVAAVVQIQARGQNPTSSGAYSGLTGGGSRFYVPLVSRKGTSVSGTTNSQIFVQNTGTADVNVSIKLVNTDASTRYTKSGIIIKPGASFEYDLALESASNVPDNWFGSAEVFVTGSGEVAVVSNFFTGDAMQTFNAFPDTAPGKTWFVPLFTSRLPNTLSTPIAVQNLSGAPIAVDGVVVTCTPVGGGTPLVLKNKTVIGNTAAYYFNPVTDTTIPAGFAGSCVIQSTSNIVAFVQMRFIATGEAAAYEAIPAGGTDKKVVIPLVAKRLANGFATAVTIQNLDTANAATVTLTYKPSTGTAIVIPGVTIPAGGSLIQNHRTADGVTQLPAGWVGSLVVESDKPVHAFVQLTFLRDINPGLPAGDNYMAHNAFTQP